MLNLFCVCFILEPLDGGVVDSRHGSSIHCVTSINQMTGFATRTSGRIIVAARYNLSSVVRRRVVPKPHFREFLQPIY